MKMPEQGIGHETPDQPAWEAVRSGVIAGLTPLALPAGVVAVAVALTVLVRLLTSGRGYLVEQPAVVIVLSIGLVIAAVVFVVACRRTLRQVAVWQHAGNQLEARAALGALGLTVVVLIVPLLVAALLPQHPAP